MMTPHSKRRVTLAAAAVASVSILLTACSGSPDAGGGATADLSNPAPKGVTITLWHTSGDSPALLNLYKAYEKASGNKIDLVTLPNDTYPQTVQTKWSTGDRPDVLEYNPSSQDMAQLNVTQNMVDLSSMGFVKAEGNLAKTSGSVNGKTYGAILGPNSTFGVFYNKKVLEDAGITTPPTSFSDLADACTAIKAGGVTPIYQAGGSQFPAMMLPAFTYMTDYNANDAYGQAVKNGKTKVNDPKGPFVAALDAYAKLGSSGCYNHDATTATWQQGVKAVVDGTAAMIVLPSDFIPNFYGDGAKSTIDSTIGLGALSAKKGIASYSPSEGFFVPKTGDATKQRAAEDFINWITTKGYQSYVDEAQIVPTLSTATAPKLNGLSSDVQKMLESSDATLSVNASIPGFGNFGTIAVKVLAGQATPQQGADQFQTFIDQARAAQK
jgi:raffinose/stachyose/melibiose transport system substrate-binding protein